MYYTEENKKYHKDIKARERLVQVALYLSFPSSGIHRLEHVLEIPASAIGLGRDGRDSNRRS